MKKYFIQLYPNDIGYGQIQDFYTQNFALQYLWFSLYRKEYEWIQNFKIDEKITFWSSDSIKQMADVFFSKKEDSDLFYLSYREYCKKRWDDMPKLELSLKNYAEIVQKWQKIVLEQRPQFIILSQDDAGYVDLVGKDELSEQDLADMKREHEKFLKYQAAYAKYSKSRPDIVDELWHGHESSEYESDWQKFLDEPLD